MKKSVIIVAGGKGSRMESEIPKQFLRLNNQPILMHTISLFYHYDKAIQIIIILPKAYIEYWDELCETNHFDIPHRVAVGGKTRFHSVKNGLNLLDSNGYIAVHDGVRPLVSMETINRCFYAAIDYNCVIPVINVTETVRMVDKNGSRPVDRSKLKIVQTPQVFSAAILQKAYKQTYNPTFTDDANVVETYGEEVTLVNGNRENVKITNPADLQIAENLLQNHQKNC